MTTDTTYVGSLFEVVSTSSSTEYRHNIIADGEVIAVHTITGTGAASTGYLHYDHLGSVDAITDNSGNVIQSMSFDAFGLRRDATNWDYDLSQNTISTLKNYTDRGFTFQEELDNVGLVHMNGRVYDPTVGRFISADPTVPAPLFSQAFNRFAYVYDSPLVYVDPTGLGGGLPCEVPEAINVGGSSTRDQKDPCQLGTVTVTGTPPPPSLNSTNTTSVPGDGPQPGTDNGPNPGKNPNGNPKGNPKQPPQQKPQPQPKPPCNEAAHAASPQTYALAGYVLQAETFIADSLPLPGINFGASAGIQLGTLSNFRRGGALDAQALGASASYANYAYGDFMSAAGYSLNFSLWGANAYASLRSSYASDKTMSPGYPSTPATNVANITNGYNAQANGTLCRP